MRKKNDIEPIDAERFSVPTQTGFLFYSYKDVVYCEGAGSQTKMYFTDQSPLMACRTLDKWMEQFSKHGFMRVHRSHGLNLLHLKGYKKEYGGQMVMDNGTHLDVSEKYRNEVLARIRSMHPDF